MVGDHGDFVEIMGLALGGKEIGGMLGGVIWWSNFEEGFACGNNRVRNRRTCRYSLCIDESQTNSV